ncbi:YndJ family transporter [Candidatus Uabimicrobium sp. HlEnr_7]|uniref:YndJ family transporter n=1 Tax=Candidatus Uabimicrobium helgolandensis TaxID=3095367 RepID=UPI003556CCDC
MPNKFSWQSSGIWRNYVAVGMTAFTILCILRPLVSLPSVGGMGYTILFAPLVIVPFVLSFISIDNKHILQRIAIILHLPAAFCAVASLCIETSTLSAVLALPWLMQNVIIALYGFVFFQHMRNHAQSLLKQLPVISVFMGCLYIPIAGVWLVSSNMGINYGFRATIVLLTVAHFHYAGFALSILAGLAGFSLNNSNNFTHKIYNSIGWIVVFCPIVVAIGIIFSPLLEMVAACTLAVAIIIFSATIAFGFSCKNIISRLCFTFAFLAMIATMILAATYALSEYYEWHIISIETMAMSHGVANAFGFTFLSLCGWMVESQYKQEEK